MTKISAKVIADSLSPKGHLLTTIQLIFPRFILAELNTHRIFSRNSASSRAIPFEKMVQAVQDDPFIPIAWQKDHKGMQGTEYLEDDLSVQFAKSTWLAGRDQAIKTAKSLNSSNNGFESITKQLCNRLLEPFMWHTVLITATEWENFFALRCPRYYYEPEDKYFNSRKDFTKYYQECFDTDDLLYTTDLEWFSINKGQAEIHMMALAEAIWDAMKESKPKQLEAGEWHIPFGDQMDINLLKKGVVDEWSKDKHRVLAHAARMDSVRDEDITFYKIRQKVATARCARISYTLPDSAVKDDYEADIKLHDRLLAAGHMSPFEHCARAMTDYEYENSQHTGWAAGKDGNEKGWCKNYRGFIQYRAMLSNENMQS